MRFINRYEEVQKAKKNEQKDLLALLGMIILGLIMTCAPMIDQFFDILFFR